VTELAHGYQMVIGLEVHTELATATKLFCGCPNQFGSDPNTNVCPVCLGLPGSMPVINEAAIDFAMRLGRALHCEVRPSEFARKNYFYPDMPKDYQVSQYDQPLNAEGYLDLPDGTRVGIERAHVEEDTGKSTHVDGGGRIHDAGYSLVDYNRSGVPLVEIVSKPDVRSAEQAKAYASELRAILVATGVSDAKMEEGSMRVDANVSVHKPGTPFGTRCEIKNLNSIRSLGRAIEYEARRQIDLIEAVIGQGNDPIRFWPVYPGPPKKPMAGFAGHEAAVLQRVRPELVLEPDPAEGDEQIAMLGDAVPGGKGAAGQSLLAEDVGDHRVAGGIAVGVDLRRIAAEQAEEAV
jgi:aspartyl/glutamyl-tRNA(Asn/Gln) amidotransferase B subunit